MNEQEQFEQQLRKQPLRTLPTEWRNEILSAAFAVDPGSTPSNTRERSGQGRQGRFLEVLRGLLWPHPVAWGALAAVWLAIAAINFSVRDDGFAAAATTSAQVEPQQLRALLAEQQRVLAEILSEASLPAEPADARPRSARVTRMICV